MKQQTNNMQLASEWRTVITRLIKKLRNKSETGARLSLTERSTLALLDQYKELSPGELAAMEKITAQSMSQILNHLSTLGYTRRNISRTDKRKSIITLSKKGQRILHKVRNERDEWLHQAIARTCTAREIEVLQRALIPLKKLVDAE